jgi:hypothetical protein
VTRFSSPCHFFATNRFTCPIGSSPCALLPTPVPARRPRDCLRPCAGPCRIGACRRNAGFAPLPYGRLALSHPTHSQPTPAQLASTPAPSCGPPDVSMGGRKKVQVFSPTLTLYPNP